MAGTPSHLVERLAGRLRGIGGLEATAPAPARYKPTPDDAAAAADDAAPEGFAATLGRMPETMPADVPPAPTEIRTGVTPLGPVDLPAGQSFKAPALGLDALEHAGLVVGRKLRTRISEEFRITIGAVLRSINTSYTPGRAAGNLLMVTSARPGEGKSFTALNLAGSIAQHTQREVLLVDVDAKQQSISDLLGASDRPGLIDLAAPSVRIEDCILNTAIANLSVLPVGVRHTEDGDLAQRTVARPIATMIERLSRRFPNHLIILDAPPCLSTSDPSTLAGVVGQIVLVVEAEKTQRSEILASLDLLKSCPTVTLLLNKIKVTTNYTFGAYHYFGSYS